MRKIQISAMLLFLSAAAGCTKERDYDIVGTVIKRNVDFTAYNMTVGEEDSAVSTIYEESFEEAYPPTRNEIISFDYTEVYYDYTGEPQPVVKRFETELISSNMLWSGGNNEISVTFRSSCPEETSAIVYFPDGTTQEVTISSPTCVWTLDSASYSAAEEAINGMDLWYTPHGLPIYMESSYKKGNFIYRNIGYVLVEVDSYSKMLAYDSADHTWYVNYWAN